MNSFILQDIDNIDIYKVCGTKSRTTFYTASLSYLSSHENLNSIDDICNTYNVNKYYHRGIPSNRIAQCCIIPATLIYINKTYKGLVVVSDTYGIGKMLEWEIYTGEKSSNYSFYSNPLDAAYDYYMYTMTMNKQKIDYIRNTAISWKENKQELIEKKRKELIDLYMVQINNDLDEYINNNNKTVAQYEELINIQNIFITNNLGILNKLNIDLSKFKEDL